MNNIWIIAKINFKRNITAVFLSFMGAFILIFLLNAMGKLFFDTVISTISVGVIDENKSILSRDFKDYMKNNLNFKLVENESYDELSKELIDKDISVIIEIPEDFYEKFISKQQSGVTVTSLDDYENTAFTRIYIDNYLKSIHILSIGAAGKREVFDQLLDSYNKENIPIKQEAAKMINRKEIADQNGFIISIGFYLMITFGLCFFLSFLVLDDQLSGVFNRIQITPVKPIQYIIGSGVLGFIIYLILIVIYCGYIYIADIHIGISITKLLFLMILFSLFTICFSFVLAFTAKSKNAITSIIAGFASIGCALGGAYFPVDKAPELFQKVARIMPQFWFMDALYRLQADAAAKVYPNYIILGLFTILSLLIGAVLFSKNYKKS